MKKIHILLGMLLIAGTVQANRIITVEEYYRAIDGDDDRTMACFAQKHCFNQHLGQAILLVHLYEDVLQDSLKVGRYLWNTYASSENASRAEVTMQEALQRVKKKHTSTVGRQKEIHFYNTMLVHMHEFLEAQNSKN